MHEPLKQKAVVPPILERIKIKVVNEKCLEVSVNAFGILRASILTVTPFLTTLIVVSDLAESQTSAHVHFSICSTSVYIIHFCSE